MTYRLQYDAAYPPVDPPQTDSALIYVGGYAEHIWNAAEIVAQGKRCLMPTWVYNPTGQNNEDTALAFRAWLVAHDVPHECAVCIDIETSVDIPFCEAMYNQLEPWTTLLYGSPGSLFGNPEPDGWYVADPTGAPHLFNHELVLATQYAWGGSREWNQTPGNYDLSLLSPALTLWDPAASALKHLTTDGTESLREIAARSHVAISNIIRDTIDHTPGHHFTAGLAAYLNRTRNLNEPVPEGVHLVVNPGAIQK